MRSARVAESVMPSSCCPFLRAAARVADSLFFEKPYSPDTVVEACAKLP